MVLVLEIVVASVAVVLIMLSVKTMQSIKHLGVGKSFWTPVAVSGFLFFFGSTIAILFELNISLTTYTDEVVQISRLLALSTLVVGVYSYARKINRNLAEKFTASERSVKTGHQVEAKAPVHDGGPEPLSSIQERIIRESEKKKTMECRYKFGHLRTLPRDASIPDECLSCDKIIECKHSLTKTLESQATPPP